MAGTWNESGLSYRGRSHGHIRLFFFELIWSKASHEKSAEVIVITGNEPKKKKSDWSHKVMKD